MDRAAEGVHAPLLLTGDSSGLVGVDAPKLAATLGVSVQSLSTMGNVGPAGWGGLLERDRRGGPPTRLFFLFMAMPRSGRCHQTSSNMPGCMASGRNSVRRESTARRALRFGYLGNYPLPGAWGRDYGSAARAGKATRSPAGYDRRPHSSCVLPAGRLSIPFIRLDRRQIACPCEGAARSRSETADARHHADTTALHGTVKRAVAGCPRRGTGRSARNRPK